MSVYLIFALITSFLGAVFDRSEHTMVNNIGGALFSLFESFILLGIIFNCTAASRPDSALARSGSHDDGNVVELVMLLSPALLGGPDAEDYALTLQLRDAKKISCTTADSISDPLCELQS